MRLQSLSPYRLMSYRHFLSTTLILIGASLLSGTPSLAEQVSSPVVRPTEIAQVKSKDKKLTIVEIAASSDSFKTLTAALKAAGLVEVLSGKGPFTVFAPTDEAFAALPKGTLENLLKPENKATLVKILTYHVVSGKVLSTDLKSGKVPTVEGRDVTIKVGKAVTVNNAQVVKADIKASNGVIHVIDKVLLPPN